MVFLVHAPHNKWLDKQFSILEKSLKKHHPNDQIIRCTQEQHKNIEDNYFLFSQYEAFLSVIPEMGLENEIICYLDPDMVCISEIESELIENLQTDLIIATPWINYQNPYKEYINWDFYKEQFKEPNLDYFINAPLICYGKTFYQLIKTAYELDIEIRKKDQHWITAMIAFIFSAAINKFKIEQNLFCICNHENIYTNNINFIHYNFPIKFTDGTMFYKKNDDECIYNFENFNYNLTPVHLPYCNTKLYNTLKEYI